MQCFLSFSRGQNVSILSGLLQHPYSWCEIQPESQYRSFMWQSNLFKLLPISGPYSSLLNAMHPGKKKKKRHKPFLLPPKTHLSFCINPLVSISVLSTTDLFFPLYLSFLECYRNESCGSFGLPSSPFCHMCEKWLLLLLLSGIPFCFVFFKNLFAISLAVVYTKGTWYWCSLRPNSTPEKQKMYWIISRFRGK